MKKIIITLMLTLIPIQSLALTNKTILNQTNKILTTKTLCKFYKPKKVLSDNYYLEGENDKEYSEKSEEFIIKTSTEQDQLPEEKPNRIIKKEVYNNYNPLKKVNRIILSINDGVNAYEIEIYDNNQKINYIFSTNNTKDYSLLNDNKIGFYQKLLYENIDIILPRKINPLDITIKLHLKKYGGNEKIYLASYLYPEDIKEKYDSNNSKNRQNEYITNIKEIIFDNYDIKEETISFTKKNIINYKYDSEKIVTKETLDSKLYFKNEDIIKYTYQDTMFKYYKIEREYQNGYHENLENYIKDEQDCITEQIYLTKDKDQFILKKLTQKNNPKENQKTTLPLNDTKEEDNLVYTETIPGLNEIKMSKNEITTPTKTNKIIYTLPVILLLILLILGYLLKKLLKER